jgi:hypothetical protein
MQVGSNLGKPHKHLIRAMPQGGTDNADDENITITDENFTRDDLDDSANSTFIKYD